MNTSTIIALAIAGIVLIWKTLAEVWKKEKQKTASAVRKPRLKTAATGKRPARPATKPARPTAEPAPMATPPRPFAHTAAAAPLAPRTDRQETQATEDRLDEVRRGIIWSEILQRKY